MIHPPVLLRNRPNVPPPVVEPTDDNNAMISVGNVGNVGDIGDIGMTEATPVEIITIPQSLPVPDIKSAPVTYRVKKGDSFWRVARMYGVTKEELATCNNLSLNKPLRTGTSLLIPPGGEFIPENKRPKIKRSAAPKPVARKTTPRKPATRKTVEYTPSLNDGKYTVQPGDSLWKISRKFHVTTSQLMQANNLDSKNLIHVGKTLIIPGAGNIAEPKRTAPVTVTKKPETKTEIVDNATAETIDNTAAANEADQLLNDAVKAAEENTQSPEDAAGDILTDLDKATQIADVEPAGSLYTEEVLPNETIQDIADRHGMTPEEIRAVNPGLPADGKLKPFTSIKIPNK
jgi:LysM repeat protein